MPDCLFAMPRDVLCDFGILLVCQQLGDRILEHPSCELAAANSHAHCFVFDVFLQNSDLLSSKKGRPFCDLPMTYLRCFLLRTA